jgi:hypothetical protein
MLQRVILPLQRDSDVLDRHRLLVLGALYTTVTILGR